MGGELNELLHFAAKRNSLPPFFCVKSSYYIKADDIRNDHCCYFGHKKYSIDKDRDIGNVCI